MAADDRSAELYASTIFGLTIATVSVALRCYVRLCMLKIFSWEDYLAVVSLIFFGGYGSCVFLSIQYGAGRHLENVPVEWLPSALKFRWLGEWLYVVTSILVKITVSILLLRICSKTWHKAVIYTTLAVVVVWNTIYTFLAAFQCVPVQHFWERLSDPAGGSCLSEEIITGTTYAAAGINCLADWILGLLPIALVWNLELNGRTKASIAGILALGIIASAATIVRIPYVWQLTHDSDFLYVFVDFTTWSTTELAMGLAASSIATLRPLFKKVLGGTSGTGSRRSRGRGRQAGAATPKRVSTRFSGIKGLVIHRRDEISMETPMPITPTTAVYTTRRNSVSSATVDVERYAIAPWERGLGNEDWKYRELLSPQGSEFFLWPPKLWLEFELESERVPPLWGTIPLAVSILRTSKRVYAEAVSILYGENTLYMCRSPHSIKGLLQAIGRRNAGLIQRVAVGWDYFHFPTLFKDDGSDNICTWMYATDPSPVSLLAEAGCCAGLTERVGAWREKRRERERGYGKTCAFCSSTC